MNNLEEALKKVLTIMDYKSEEILKICNDLNRLVLIETTEKLLKLLSDDDKNKLRLQIESQTLSDSKQTMVNILKSSFSEQEIQNQMDTTSVEIVVDYIKNITEKSSTEQKTAIKKILDTFGGDGGN